MNAGGVALPAAVADQIGQHLGVAGIGLRSRQVVAVQMGGYRHRVDGIHLLAGPGQGVHPQTPVGFDPDSYLGGIIGMVGDQLMETPDPFHAVSQICELAPGLAPSVGDSLP